MVFIWSQILSVAYFANIVFCGNIRSSKEDTTGIFKETEMNEISRTSDICPDENSEVPVFLAYADDCSKFYICDNGTPYLKSCQPGLHFNTKVNSCDYPRNVGCDKKTTSKGDGRIAEEKMSFCPSEDSELPVHLAHADDCTKFYVCDNGTPHLKSCQPGLHFNPSLNACDYPKNAGCDKKQEIKEKGKIVERVFDTCPPENEENPVYIVHHSDCNKFYVCDNGEAIPKSCQPGLHFNPKTNTCDYPQNAGCDKSIATKSKDSNQGKEWETCPPENSDDPLYLAHPEDCSKFYVCDSGKPHLESCPAGLHFNSKVKVCDYPKNAGCEKILQGVVHRSGDKERDDFLDFCPSDTNGRPVFIPHSTACDKFFICKEGKKFPFSCPQGLQFNSKQDVCDFPENTDCEKGRLMRAGVSSPFCPPMDGKSPVFFRHSNNCNVYYMCGNGLAYEFSCPARLHFNLRKKVCDYEVNANCKVVDS